MHKYSLHICMDKIILIFFKVRVFMIFIPDATITEIIVTKLACVIHNFSCSFASFIDVVGASTFAFNDITDIVKINVHLSVMGYYNGKTNGILQMIHEELFVFWR